jgi:hypothetical protein
MAEGKGKFEPFRGSRGLQHMKIRVAGASATNLDQDLPGARLGDCYFTKLGRLLELDELVCFHDFLITL